MAHKKKRTRREMGIDRIPANAITQWLLADGPATLYKTVSEMDYHVDYNGDIVSQYVKHNLAYLSHHKGVKTNLDWALAECDERNAKTKESFCYIKYSTINKKYICICKVNKIEQDDDKE